MPEAPIPNEDGSRSERKPPRKLPDPAICRAKHSRFGDYVDCLVQAPYSECLYARKFGDGYLCLSRERKEIVARTEAEQRK